MPSPEGHTLTHNAHTCTHVLTHCTRSHTLFHTCSHAHLHPARTSWRWPSGPAAAVLRSHLLTQDPAGKGKGEAERGRASHSSPTESPPVGPSPCAGMGVPASDPSGLPAVTLCQQPHATQTLLGPWELSGCLCLSPKVPVVFGVPLASPTSRALRSESEPHHCSWAQGSVSGFSPVNATALGASLLLV